jgi:uncharacterized lipoprotein YddW (UPF0748 family)
MVAAGICLVGAPAAAQPPLPPTNPDGVAQAVIRQGGLEGRVLWLDGTANLERLSTREGVAGVLDRCVNARINTVVVDVKPLSGHVLFESRFAPKLKEWRGFQYPAGYDLLRTALAEGHRRGLRVYAAVNVFSQGHKLVHQGPAYDRPELQSTIYDVERTMLTPRGDRKTLGIGTNRAPDGNEITAYEPSYRQPRVMDNGDCWALVVGDRVDSVGDSTSAPARGVSIPANGYLLIGRGDSGRWLTTGLKPGDYLAYTSNTKLLPIQDAPGEPVAMFVNPADPVSRRQMLRVIEEIATRYDVDGVVFDRMRYASLQSDFGESSRLKFEEHLGQKLNRFPEDIFSYEGVPGKPLVWGPYFKQWLEWRARNIRTFLEEASKIVREKRPEAKIGAYVGAWYPTYYTVGVNWGSEEYTPGYDWMTASYSSTGYAGLLDWICTGCYHPVATREQARGAGLDENLTVQASAETSTRAVGDVCFVYAGLYVLDYKTSPQGFREALQAARSYSHGVMIFDLMHIEEYGLWTVLEQELPGKKTAPHDVPGLLAAVRELRRVVSSANRN